MIILLVFLTIFSFVTLFITRIIISGINPKGEYTLGTIKRIKLIRAVILSACAFIAAMSVLVSGVKIIDQAEIGIVKTFGRIDRTIHGGLNFINPVSEKAYLPFATPCD